MIPQKINSDGSSENKIADIVVWDVKYATGVRLVDQQHRELVALTNRLYHACMGEHAAVDSVFKESMSRMVEYVRFHFGAEQNLLQKIGYPNYPDHKRKHEALVKTILEAAQEYRESKTFIPYQFVRKLQDWVFSHIAIEDQIYAVYVAEQRKRGLLSDEELERL